MHVRVLRLDIEGAETDALIGAQRFLNDKIADVVLPEAEPVRLKAFGRSGFEIADMMAGNGYVAVCLIESERIMPVIEARRIPGTFNGDYLYVRQPLYVDAFASIFGT